VIRKGGTRVFVGLFNQDGQWSGEVEGHMGMGNPDPDQEGR